MGMNTFETKVSGLLAAGALLACTLLAACGDVDVNASAGEDDSADALDAGGADTVTLEVTTTQGCDPVECESRSYCVAIDAETDECHAYACDGAGLTCEETIYLDGDTRCETLSDGTVLEGTDELGSCESAVFCAPNGTAEVFALTCSGQVPVLMSTGQSSACVRDTEGLTLPGSERDGGCRPVTATFCENSGSVTQTATVCRSGLPVTEVVDDSECIIETEGAHVPGTLVNGPCLADNPCALRGQRTASVDVCRSGVPVTESLADDGCTRDVDGTTIAGTQENVCVPASSGACSGTYEVWAQTCRGGEQTRERISTSGGACSAELNGQICRFLNGRPANWCCNGTCGGGC